MSSFVLPISLSFLSFPVRALRPSLPGPLGCLERPLDTQWLCPAFNIEFLFFVGLDTPTALGVNTYRDSQDVSDPGLVSHHVLARGWASVGFQEGKGNEDGAWGSQTWSLSGVGAAGFRSSDSCFPLGGPRNGAVQRTQV